MTQVIKIEWLLDTHDCETCGYSYAEGAKVFIDGELHLNFEPVAHCCNTTTYSQEEVYTALLSYLGYYVE